MKSIREIISTNITKLRKKCGLTQVELSKRINFSDKAVSRWEKGEVLPDVETLQVLAHEFGVTLPYLMQEHDFDLDLKKKNKITYNQVMLQALTICIIWTIATILFVYLQVYYNHTFWQAFVWSVPITCLILLEFNRKRTGIVFKSIIRSVFSWTLLSAFYLQLLNLNLWLIFIIGIPVQATIIVAGFAKPYLKEN